MTDSAIRDVVSSFDLGGEILDLLPLKIGHINETYVSRVRDSKGGVRRYVHQLINEAVFRDVPHVMRNIERVTGHIQSKIDRGEGIEGEQTLQLVSTRDGALIVCDARGAKWRTYRYVEGTYNVSQCSSGEEAVEAGRTFGRFQRYLFDLPGEPLVDPIPGFQDSAARMVALEHAIAADEHGRVRDVRREIEFIRARTAEASKLVTLLNNGSLPRRVTHGDTKLNNVLFSERTRRGVCVVDLDTCMSGTILFDIGDLIRNTAQTAAEDERDLARVNVDLTLVEGLVRGYVEAIGSALAPAERRYLPNSALWLAVTLGARFLTDHLNGDQYFRIHRPGHNLDRARTQLKMAESFERYQREIELIVERYS